MILNRDTAAEIIDLNPGEVIDQAIADRQFNVIVEGFNHLYNGNDFIYIADEVGLGKTYIAIGISTLLRHFNEDPGSFSDLIIVPKKNLQIKWQKEIKRFVSNNYLLQDNRVKSIIDQPIGLIGKNQIHDKFRPIAETVASYNLFRMSSFSMGTHENFEWKEEFELIPNGLETFKKVGKRRDNSFYRRLYGILVNICTPQIECAIIDEVHNFKHGVEGAVSQRNEVLSRYMGNIFEEDNDIFEALPELKEKIKPLAKKKILLSATPIDKGLYQLKNQLDVFQPNHKYRNIQPDLIESTLKEDLSKFLIRGVMNIKLGDREYSRNMYRYEHRNGNVKCEPDSSPITLSDDKLAFITGLVQYKTMEELSLKNNNSFEIGLLAGFESFKPKPKTQDEEFDKSIDTDQKEAIDSNVIQRIANSYFKDFGKPLPHLKQDAIVEELFHSLVQGEKALVFVRRIASVNELELKLLEKYTSFLFDKINNFSKRNRNPRLQVLTKSFKERLKRKEIEEVLSLLSKRININNLNSLINADLHIQSKDELTILLTLLYDAPSEDESWQNLKKELIDYQKMVLKHLGREKRIDSKLSELALYLLENSVAQLTDELDPDDTLENEDQLFDEGEKTVYFFEEFFKGKGKTFRKATYDNSWYELNLYVLNRKYKLFNVDIDNLKKLKQSKETRKEGTLFKNEQDNYENLIFDEQYKKHKVKSELLKKETFLTQLLLVVCEKEFNEWIINKRKLHKEAFFESLKSLVEILKGIFRNGSGRIPAYLAWSTSNFEQELINLLTTDFEFVLNEIKTVIKDFDKIIASNFPESTKIKYTLYNQLPVQGVSGNHKINVSKIAAQFRMPGYPYVLIATDILKEGEDLHTYCKNVYHYGIAWNPSDMEQRTGRIDRIGSKCYYKLKENGNSEIQFDKELQVFFPYLKDTFEVNQVAKVFNGMDEFINTFYDFTEAKRADNKGSLADVVKDIPKQITSKLKSKYDIDKFKAECKDEHELRLQESIGLSLVELKKKVTEFNHYIETKHVDRKDEYSNFDERTLQIKGLIYNEEKERQCPFKIRITNNHIPGSFNYEIISPITSRRNLNSGAMRAIREKLPDDQLFEVNSILYARTNAQLDSSNEEILKTLEKLVFLADDLEEQYAKEDLNYWNM